MMREKRRWLTLVVIGLAVVLAITGWIVRGQCVRRTLVEARRAMARGRFVEARARLTWLARCCPTGGEADYLLGHCEQAAGRLRAALAAWADVPADSTFGELALLNRGALLIKLGRFAE